jgi:hypothetical protein
VQSVAEGDAFMSLLDKLGIDTAKTKASKIEQEMELGGRVPPGMHHAVLVGARNGVSSGKETEFRELTFRVLAGTAAGMELKDKIWFPNAGQEERSRNTSQNRLLIFMHRLGVIKKDGDVFVPIPGREDFQDVVDKVDCVIVVKHESRDYAGQDGKQRHGIFAILDFEGVLLKDDKRCEKVAKIKFEPAQASSLTGPIPTQTKQEERKKKYANV